MASVANLEEMPVKTGIQCAAAPIMYWMAAFAGISNRQSPPQLIAR